MTLIIPDGFAQVLHSMTLTGDPNPYACTYGIDITGAVPSDVAAIASSMRANWASNINPLMPSVLQQTQTQVRAKFAGVAAEVIGLSTVTSVGAGGSTALVPQNTAHLCHKTTSFGGRTGRGRFYLPAVNEANVDMVGVLTPAWIATCNTALTALLGGIVGAALVVGPVLLHDSTGAGATLPPYNITGFSMDSVVATQRRRLRK